MTNYRDEIEASSRCVDQYTRMALGKEAVAECLLEQAALDREKAAHWQEQLSGFLEKAGIVNVVPLPLPPVGETIA